MLLFAKSPELPKLTEPTILGELDPEVLPKIGSLLLHRAARRRFAVAKKKSTWKVDGEKPPEPMGDLLESISVMLKDGGYKNIKKIVSIIFAQPVLPEQGHAAVWHRDGVNYSRLAGRLVVSDQLPTQVLIGNEDDPNPAASARKIDSLLDQGEIPGDDGLSRLALRVWTPEPNQVVEIEDYIHRGQINHSDKTVYRTFAGIFPLWP